MEIKINVPLKSQIVYSGIKIPIARKKGDKWSKLILGDYANKRGVYIHHSQYFRM